MEDSLPLTREPRYPIRHDGPELIWKVCEGGERREGRGGEGRGEDDGYHHEQMTQADTR